MKWLGAISQDDADRWIRLGVPPGAVAVTGDPRHDAVIERVPSPAGLEPLRAWRHAAAVMVARSTHRSDEGVLLDAAAVLTERPDAKLLVVPHEPNATTLNRILSGAVHRGVRASPWRSGDPAPDASVVVVNAMGLLFDVYALANSVYVGGGFDRAGLHSSIEPAGFGLPLIFGPEWKTSLDAARLVASGGAVALPRRGAGTALAAIWRRWFDDPQEAAAAGLAARGVLMEGAAGSTARAVLRLIAGG